MQHALAAGGGRRERLLLPLNSGPVAHTTGARMGGLA